MKPLTEKQKLVLKVMYDNAMGCTAGDFGFVDEVIEILKDHMSVYQIGAVISTLSEKNLIKVWKRTRINDMYGYIIHVKQFTFHDIEEIKELVE